MNCQQFEARLNDLLDERAPLELDDAALDDESRTHARGCASCRELCSGYTQLSLAMRFRAPPAPSSDVAARIVAAAVADRGDFTVSAAPRRVPAARGHRVWWRTAGVAAAAAVLIAVCWRFEPPANQAVPPGGQVAHTPPAAEPRPLSELAQDAASCYAGLATETRSDLSDVLALVPRVESTPAGVLWNTGGRTPSPEVASQVREGLRPLAQSTMAALTSLFGGSTPENSDL